MPVLSTLFGPDHLSDVGQCGSPTSVPEPNGGEDEDVIHAGDFVIDVDARSASVRGRDLHLNAAEFDVLTFLSSHRRRIVTGHTRLSTRSEEGQVHKTAFVPALLSLKRKLQEAVPDAHYLRMESWLLVDFQPDSDRR